MKIEKQNYSNGIKISKGLLDVIERKRKQYCEVVLCTEPCTSWINVELRYFLYQNEINKERKPLGKSISDLTTNL